YLGAGNCGGEGAGNIPGGRAITGAGPYGAAGAAGERLGGSPGATGLPSQATLAPNFDAAAADRYSAARAATFDRKQTFRNSFLGKLLRPGPGGSDYSIPDSNVPRSILTGRADEASRIRQFTGAAGNGSQELRRDALVADLRRSGIVQPDGTLK